LQLPVKPALDQVSVLEPEEALPLNEPEQPAVWLMLKLMVPVKEVESTVPLMFPATPLEPVWAAHVPVTVALV